jgi:hypothetical protein
MINSQLNGDHFRTRYRAWAEGLLQRELDTNWIRVRRLQGITAVVFLSFLDSLSDGTERKFAEALLKRTHQSGDSLSEAERELITRYFNAGIYRDSLGRTTVDVPEALLAMQHHEPIDRKALNASMQKRLAEIHGADGESMGGRYIL